MGRPLNVYSILFKGKESIQSVPPKEKGQYFMYIEEILLKMEEVTGGTKEEDKKVTKNRI